VCPFNAGPAARVDRWLRPRTLDHALPDLVALAGKGANQLRQAGPAHRAAPHTRDALLRNIAVALGKHRGPAGDPAARRAARSPRPAGAAHAVWPLGDWAPATSSPATATTIRSSPTSHGRPANCGDATYAANADLRLADQRPRRRASAC
jgi:hypothetical protein